MRRLFTLLTLALFCTPMLRAQVIFSSNFDDLGGLVVEKYFSDSSLTSGGWTTQDVTGAQSWQIGNFSGNNPYAEMNGFDQSGGTAVENEDWYISPALDASQGLYMEFLNAKNFTGPDMELLVSENYDGTSAPSTANWDTIGFNKSTGGFDWVNSGMIDLTPYTSTDFYVAFVYNSTDTEAAHWEVDDVRISTEPLQWFGEKTNIEMDSVSTITSNVNYGNYGVELINTEQNHRRFTTKPMQVDSGESYDVTFWVQGGGSARAGLYDGDTVDFGYHYGDWENINSPSSWQEITQTVTPDTTNDSAEFILSVSYTYPSDGHLKFDSVVVMVEGTSSIAEHDDDEGEFHAFPNPASERVQVQTRGYGTDLELKLIDRTGRIVRSLSTERSTRFDLPVDDLSSGVYLLQLRHGEELEHRKLVVE